MKENKKTGKNLKKYRTANGFSQKDLSDKIEVSQSLISQWENGKPIPDDSLKKLNEVFGDWNMEREKVKNFDSSETPDGPGPLGAWINKVRIQKKCLYRNSQIKLDYLRQQFTT